MEYIEKIIEMGPASVFLAIILVAVCIKFLFELADWFLTFFGIETKWSLKKKAMENEIEALRKEVDTYKDNRIHDREQSFEIQRQLTENQNEIKKSITSLTKMFVKKEIDDMRWDILEFGSGVMANRPYSKEQYDHVFEVYQDYEKILAENGMENGRVDMSMSFVRKKYAEKMEKGFDE